MRNVKLTIQYDGTNYSGWQSQKNSVAVQDVLEQAITKLLGEKVRVIGAARTDSKVHAACQVANFRTGSRLPAKNIKNGINRNLPADIVVAKVEDAGRDFHSQFDARKKLYRYTIFLGDTVPPFIRNYVAPISYKLDAAVMRREAKGLVGRHDFSSFQGARSERKTTVRKIYRIDIRKNGKILEFDIEASGFLYNMARTIVGTLIDIGRGHLGKGSAKRILKSRDRRMAGITAPACGLCLMKVKY